MPDLFMVLPIDISHTRSHSQEIVVGNNMDKIYIVMDYVEHDLKALMETMQTNFLEGISVM